MISVPAKYIKPQNQGALFFYACVQRSRFVPCPFRLGPLLRCIDYNLKCLKCLQAYAYAKGLTCIGCINVHEPEMKQCPITSITFIICPDRSCNLFLKPDCTIPCERDCPKQDEMKKAVVCGCGEVIVLDGNHSQLCRVDHNCSDGCNRSNFARISGSYTKVFSKEEIS